MGTRHVTVVKNENNEILLCMFGMYDGSFEYYGQELLDWLKSLELVNGFGIERPSYQVNGMGDLAGMLLLHFKKKPGEFYLESYRDLMAEYEYHVYLKNGKLALDQYQDGELKHTRTW